MNGEKGWLHWYEWTVNKIGVEGTKTLCNMLKVNTTLTTLILECKEEEKTGWKKAKEMLTLSRQWYSRRRSKGNKWNAESEHNSDINGSELWIQRKKEEIEKEEEC